MDFINKALAQLGELFRSMTPAARITAGMLLVVIVISVTYLFNHQFSSGDAYLFGGEAVSASEIGPMQAAFGKANLNDAEFDGNRIRVPSGKQAAYMAAAGRRRRVAAQFRRRDETDARHEQLYGQQSQTAGDDEARIRTRAKGYHLQNAASKRPRWCTTSKIRWASMQKTITASVQVKPQGNLC